MPTRHDHLEPTPEAVEAILALPVEGALQTVSCLKFNGPDADVSGAPILAEAAYRQWLTKLRACLEEVGGRLVTVSRAGTAIIGPAPSWDLMVVLEFPNRDSLVRMMFSERFLDALPDRRRALSWSTIHVAAPFPDPAPH